MLTIHPLDSLALQLKTSLASLHLDQMRFGDPDAMKGAKDETETLFRRFKKAQAAKVDPYNIVMEFLRGATPSSEQLHALAGALAKPLREMNSGQPLGLPNLEQLLRHYDRAAQVGELSVLTWFSLLCSYFEFNPRTALATERKGWETLRSFLRHSWPGIDRLAGRDLVPDWVKVLREHPDLLTDRATDRFGLDFLNGDNRAIQSLATDLGIPESSWFWHLLIVSAIRQSAGLEDEPFKAHIPRLMALLSNRPVFRDDGLALILTRYQRCASAPIHRALADYLLRKDVWRSPELHAEGLAPAWDRVDEPVRAMVQSWVNDGNLRDFFDVLATRHDGDPGRLEFWSPYLQQISWTRFVFCPQTKAVAPRHQAVRDMIGRDDGAYAAFWNARNVDACLLQIGDYLIVEFSTPGNAMVVYDARKLSFDRLALKNLGDAETLNYGFRGAAVLRVARGPAWQTEAAMGLKRLGILPDR